MNKSGWMDRKTPFFEFQVACKFFPLCDPTGTPKKNFGALAALEVENSKKVVFWNRLLSSGPVKRAKNLHKVEWSEK